MLQPVNSDYSTKDDENKGYNGSSDKPIYLTDVSPKDKPWDIHRAQAQIIELLYRTSKVFEKYASRIGNCTGNLGFIWDIDQETGERKLKLKEARFCRVRYCPVCQWRRSLMHKARFYQILPSILEREPNAQWLFLTLTVANIPITELRSTLQEMNKAWHRLVKRKAFRPILGWIRSTEVTRSQDSKAHPHFHALLLVKPSYFKNNYISQEKWVKLWQESLRVDYKPIVDVRRAKGDSKTIAEAVKYSIKPDDLTSDADWLIELTCQTYKLRFISTGGILKDAIKEFERSEKDLLLAKDEKDLDPNRDPDLWFDWQRIEKRYKKRD